MPGEELFELNKKINQIKNTLSKRKEKVIEWNIPYKKILQPRRDKSAYLEMFYNRKEKGQSYNLDLHRKVKQSRLKIRQHHNELKELEELQKWKNLIRCKNYSKSEIKGSYPKDSEEDPRRELRKQENEKIIMEQSTISNFSRTLKNRSDPFEGVKVEKFIDFYAQMKNGEDVRPHLMKTFGVGLENTPLGKIICQQGRKDESRSLKQKGQQSETKRGKINLVKSFNNTFSEKEDIFGNSMKPNLFENRMKSIIKYHGDFWKKDFQIR